MMGHTGDSAPKTALVAAARESAALAYFVRQVGITLATAAVMASTPMIAASAFEPNSSNPYSESGMLGAARGAASSTGNAEKTVNIGLPPPDELRVLEARREAELTRLSDKLKRAEARAPQAAKPSQEMPGWSTDVTSAAAGAGDGGARFGLGGPLEAPNHDASRLENARGRATILLVMAPREKRLFNPDGVADPILCAADGCYVSTGAQAPAMYHSFHQSTGLIGRMGRGAGACNHGLVCIFRDVDLSVSTMVQPIDLKRVHHDRHEQAEAEIDTTCRVIDDRLSCSRPVHMAGYTLWVVPESLASLVGPEKLTAALSSGLRAPHTAELPSIQR